MPIEILVGILMLGGFELAQALGLTVGNTMSVGTLIVLLAFSLLAGRSKINQFSHHASSVTGYMILRS